ncbi:hypothetical protein HMPREF2779_08270 [Rothia sp. HMSC069C03]|nr:hypothetical protein HMPREF2779_08270 [Rothia sp. HMSC069C03]
MCAPHAHKDPHQRIEGEYPKSAGYKPRSITVAPRGPPASAKKPEDRQSTQEGCERAVLESEVAVTVAARSAFRPLAPYGRSTERDSAR